MIHPALVPGVFLLAYFINKRTRSRRPPNYCLKRFKTNTSSLLSKEIKESDACSQSSSSHNKSTQIRIPIFSENEVFEGDQGQSADVDLIDIERQIFRNNNKTKSSNKKSKKSSSNSTTKPKITKPNTFQTSSPQIIEIINDSDIILDARIQAHINEITNTADKKFAQIAKQLADQKKLFKNQCEEYNKLKECNKLIEIENFELNKKIEEKDRKINEFQVQVSSLKIESVSNSSKNLEIASKLSLVEEEKTNLQKELSESQSQNKILKTEKSTIEKNFTQKFQDINRLLKIEKQKIIDQQIRQKQQLANEIGYHKNLEIFEKNQQELQIEIEKIRQERDELDKEWELLGHKQDVFERNYRIFENERKQLKYDIEQLQELEIRLAAHENTTNTNTTTTSSRNNLSSIEAPSLTDIDINRHLDERLSHLKIRVKSDDTSSESGSESSESSDQNITNNTAKQPHKMPEGKENIAIVESIIENHSQPHVKNTQNTQKPKKLEPSIPGFSIIEDIEYFYDLQTDVGDGNFALVWKSIDIQTGELAAVKHIEKQKVVGKHAMLKDEVNIMRECDHENIVTLFSALESPDSFYLCMEFVSKGDLFDMISDKVKFSERESAWMLHDLGQALTYLHSRQIVHRDIKPENLLCERVDEEEIERYGPGKKMKFKLADFGLAIKCDRKSSLMTVCGKYLDIFRPQKNLPAPYHFQIF